MLKYCLLAGFAATVLQGSVITLGGDYAGNVQVSQSVTFTVPYVETGSFWFGSNANLLYPAVYLYGPPAGTPAIFYEIFSGVTYRDTPGGPLLTVGAGEQDFGTGYGFDYSGTLQNLNAVFYPGYQYTLYLQLTQSETNLNATFNSVGVVTTSGPISIQAVPEPSAWLLSLAGFTALALRIRSMRQDQAGYPI